LPALAFSVNYQTSLAGPGEFTANRVAISPDGKEIYHCTNKSWKNSKDVADHADGA